MLIITGEATDIKSIEKAMRRAWRRGVSNIWPSHCDAPILREGRMYGIWVEFGECHDTYFVTNKSTTRIVSEAN